MGFRGRVVEKDIHIEVEDYDCYVCQGCCINRSEYGIGDSGGIGQRDTSGRVTSV